jgi:hypothetical protein
MYVKNKCDNSKNEQEDNLKNIIENIKSDEKNEFWELFKKI